MQCPNKNIDDWKELVKKVGEDKAYEEYVKNNFDIPYLGKFISPNEKQQELSDKIDEVANRLILEPEEHKYSIKDKVTGVVKEIKRSVSQRIEALNKKRGFRERTEREQEIDNTKRIIGTRGHTAIQNIVNRIVQRMNSQKQDPRNSDNIPEEIYSTLENYMEQEFFSQFKAGSIFKSEVKIYSPQDDEAGTIDLLVINPDGKVDIFDWKFIDFFGKEEVPWYKEEDFNVQLGRYRQILRKAYGFTDTDFGKTRVIPISTKYKINRFSKNPFLVGVEVGGKLVENKEYLQELPITGLLDTEIETTGNEQLDNLIEKLIAQRNRLQKADVSQDKKLIIREKIQEINQSIKQIQREGDIKSFITLAKSEIARTNSSLTKLTEGNLLKAKELMSFYSEMLKHNVLTDEMEKKYENELAQITFQASKTYSKIEERMKVELENIAKQEDIQGIFDSTDSASTLGRLFRTISQSNNPIIKTFYSLISKQKNKIYSDSKKLENKISELVKSLKKEQEQKGKSGIEIFDGIVNKEQGTLIDVYSKEFNIRKSKAFAEKDTKWLLDNFVFDTDEFEKALEKNIQIWKNLYSEDIDGDKKIKRKILEYNKRYNAEDPEYVETALHKKNFFLKIDKKEEHYSPEYKQMLTQPALKNFYDFFKETIKEYQKYMEFDPQYGKFIPNIERDLIDQMFSNGIQGITGTWDLIKEHMKSKSDQQLGMIDENGRALKKIPMFYIGEVPPDKKSYDLGTSLALFGQMALNYKYMLEIEASAHILQDAMQEQKILLTNNQGNPLINKVTNKIAEITKSSTDIEQFNDYMNYYLYGLKLGEKDSLGDIDIETKSGNKYSGKKIFSAVMKTFAGKALSLNIFSGVANGLGGNANAFFEGLKGRFYNNSQYGSALYDLSTRNKQGIILTHFFDIESTNTNLKRANDLSASKVVQEFTFDKLMFLQRTGDYVVENAVLLAMCKSHTIKEGKIIKKEKSDKSLYELLDISKDTPSIPGLTDEEYGKFRKKVKYLYTTMKGNAEQDDISRIKMSVLGNMLMQFRNWIPRMADERLGNLRYTESLEQWEEGKFRTFFSHMSHNIMQNALTALGSAGFFGIGKGMFDHQLDTQADKEYSRMLKKNPTLKITQEEYRQVYKQNIKATIGEIQVLLAVVALLAMVISGTDDDKDPLRRNFIKLAQRNLTEIAFWWDPNQAITLLKTPVPIMGYVTDIYKFVQEFSGQSVGFITQDEERMQKNHPVRRFEKLFPAVNGLETIWNTGNPNYYNQK